jgi:hypothetical protein
MISLKDKILTECRNLDKVILKANETLLLMENRD